MSRRVTLRNSPICETDNPFFKVILLGGKSVFLSDSLQIFDGTNFKNDKKYTIVLSDIVEAPTDEFDVIKTRKTIVVSLKDGITLSD
jgi:hypothetical protein